jgi:ubiquinone/menaquinone biosynthesis C-methylase UbiE
VTRIPLEAIFEWDVATWSRSLSLWERHLPAELDDSHALEVGARNGGLSLYLADKGATVVCSDLTDPEERARPGHERWGVAERIEYRVADTTALPFEDESFELVAFKSVLGALTTAEAQARAMAELRRVLRPGGRLLWAENLAASRVHRLLRRHLPWASYWRYPPLAEWQEWAAGFAECHLATAGVSAALGRSERQRRILARLDGVLETVTPGGWRYAVFGIAQK